MANELLETPTRSLLSLSDFFGISREDMRRYVDAVSSGKNSAQAALQLIVAILSILPMPVKLFHAFGR